MSCPICTGSYLFDDFSKAEKRGKKVILQGDIYAIYAPDKHRCSPFSDYFTVSLRLRKCTVHLKFRTQDELNKWGLIKGERIRCEGCLHEADGKEIVFDITKVEFL